MTCHGAHLCQHYNWTQGENCGQSAQLHCYYFWHAVMTKRKTVKGTNQRCEESLNQKDRSS